MIYGQQPRPEWERAFPDYMLERFDFWRAGIRDWRASDPSAYGPKEETAEEPR